MEREQKPGHFFFDHRRAQIEKAFIPLYGYFYEASHHGNAEQQVLFRSHRKTFCALIADLLAWNEKEGTDDV
jgi:hypothetical protein